MSSVIALFSSARRDGNTAHFLQGLKKQWPMDVVYLDDYDINEYDYKHNNQHDDFLPIMKRILNYEGIVFVSPVYWYSLDTVVFADKSLEGDYCHC